MLSSLKIMCSNNPKIRSDGCCDWVGEYGTFVAHYKVCQNKPLTGDLKVTSTTNKLAEVPSDQYASNSAISCNASTAAGPTPSTSSPPGEDTQSETSSQDDSPNRKWQECKQHESPERKPPASTQVSQRKSAPVAPPVKSTTKTKEPAAPKVVQPKTILEEAPKMETVVAVHNFTPSDDSGMVPVNAG